MVDKLKPLLRLAGHTVFSFLAAVAGGCTLYGLLRPILGAERYHQLTQTPAMMVLLLALVGIGGVEGYRRWPVRGAFFAWAIPAIRVFHLLVSRGWAIMNEKGADSFFFLGIGTAYSVGAMLAASVIRKRLHLRS